MKKYYNENGVTLVEVLAVITISAIFVGLLYSLLISFLNTEKKVTTDTLLRDEADYYMANLINSIYTLKESDVCGGLVTSNNPNEPASYIKTKDNNGNCSNTSPITGFFYQNNELLLYINGVKINQHNKNVKIDKSSKIEKEDNVYKITLTLLYNGKTKSYFTEIHSIKDI